MGNRYGLDDDCDALPHLDTAGVCNRCGKVLVGRQTQWCSQECSDALSREHNWTLARNAAKRRDHHRCVRCGGDGREQRPKQWRTAWATELARLGIALPEGEGANAVLIALPPLTWLEVNHIAPRVGRGYGFGCHNHLANLETLCHGCHVDETNRQAAQRRGDLPRVQQPDLFSELGL